MCSSSSHTECANPFGLLPRSSGGRPLSTLSRDECACSQSSEEATIARQSSLLLTGPSRLNVTTQCERLLRDGASPDQYCPAHRQSETNERQSPRAALG